MHKVTLVFGEYLKRSVTLPISLTYRDHRTTSSYNKDQLVFFLVGQLRMHSHRWKRISLKLSDQYFPHLLTTPYNVSSLEHLSLDLNGCLERCCIRLNLKSAKNLKSFEYSGPKYLRVDNIDFHWEQLEEVSFQYSGSRGGVVSSGHLECLALCRNITTCSLDAYTGDDIHSQTITLPCLRVLRVGVSGWRPNLNGAIDFLILPHLQRLEIDSDSFFYPGSFSTFHDCKVSNLLERSRCSLSHLSIQGVSLPCDEILRCLELSSTLSSFSYIPHAQSYDPFCDVIYYLRVGWSLAERDRIPTEEHETQAGFLVLLPELRELTVGTSKPAYLKTIMALLWSRGGSRAGAAGVAALRRVRVVFLDTMKRPADPVHVACLRTELQEWVSEMKKEKNGSEIVEGGLETFTGITPPPSRQFTIGGSMPVMVCGGL